MNKRADRRAETQDMRIETLGFDHRSVPERRAHARAAAIRVLRRSVERVDQVEPGVEEALACMRTEFTGPGHALYTCRRLSEINALEHVTCPLSRASARRLLAMTHAAYQDMVGLIASAPILRAAAVAHPEVGAAQLQALDAWIACSERIAAELKHEVVQLCEIVASRRRTIWVWIIERSAPATN